MRRRERIGFQRIEVSIAMQLDGEAPGLLTEGGCGEDILDGELLSTVQSVKRTSQLDRRKDEEASTPHENIIIAENCQSSRSVKYFGVMSAGPRARRAGIMPSF